MRLLFILLLAGALASCNTQRRLTYTVRTEPNQSIAPQPKKILLFNTYDPATANNRKNAEEISRELTDDVLNQLADVISRRMNVPTEVVPGLTHLAPFGNPVGQLLQKHSATHAIVITFFDIAFDQTRVDVTKTSEGKSREAYYDICNTINFELHDSTTLIDKSSYPVCRPHSSRAVASGLLAFGPSYKSNKSDFAKLSTQSSQVFLRRHFPGEATVTRPLFTGGDFKAAAAAVARNDWDAALTEYQRIAETAKDRVAAMALYNCAVLSERRSDRNEAYRFLRESVRRMLLPESQLMYRDFNDMTDR
jgi:hypothetical protein